ncbi:MAG: hypothetical protein AAGA66_18620 [Bacteroidota bacterium]
MKEQSRSFALAMMKLLALISLLMSISFHSDAQLSGSTSSVQGATSCSLNRDGHDGHGAFLSFAAARHQQLNTTINTYIP